MSADTHQRDASSIALGSYIAGAPVPTDKTDREEDDQA